MSKKEVNQKAAQKNVKVEKTKEPKKRSLRSLDQDIYTTGDVDELIGVSQRMVRFWINGNGTRQRLKAFRCGKILRIARDDLREFLAVHYDRSLESDVSRAKYRTKKKNRGVDMAVAAVRKRQTEDTLKRMGVIQ